MKFAIFLILIFISLSSAFAQNNFRAKIKDIETSEALVGVTARVKGTTLGATSQLNGILEISNIPSGKVTIEIRYLSYTTKIISLNFPLENESVVEVFLEAHEEEMEEVIITATRSSRTILDIPTRIEAISGEELEEKGNMKPGDIRMLLNESTGIQTQQTSATSYNSSIRIQGLDGKYTQILRDGLPLYAGFSGGLSLLQIAPLDLKQVEVVKGAASTLYGEGAIAGLVNLVTKTPEEERELSFLINGTSALGMDMSGFYAKRNEKVGTTIFASYNLGTAYDPSNIGLSAIPKFRRYTINPRLFLYPSEATTITLGINTTIEERIGGAIDYIENGGSNLYFEKNNTDRLSGQFVIEHQIDNDSKLFFKNSGNYFNRTINPPNYQFSGLQVSSFHGLSYRTSKEKVEWIGGLNLWTDNFTQNDIAPDDALDYSFTTAGFFIQNTWNTSDRIILETGMRGDYQSKYGFFALPRFSALFKINENLTARLGGGLGYKSPTAFTEDAERVLFRNVQPINTNVIDAEQSKGANLDLNYRTELSSKSTFSINALLFYTQVNNPILLALNTTEQYAYQQPKGYIDTKGLETNIKITYNDFKLFVGYTLADVNEHYNDATNQFPLVAKHRLNNVLMYEVEEKWKIGLEAYYFSEQLLNDGATGKAYWINGLMMERLWESFSVFLNFENFLDTRQSKFDTIYTGSLSNPTFRDIYAPVDGFVINGGLKIRL